MSIEGQSFNAQPTPEIYGVERLHVSLSPAENPDYSYVKIDAGEGIGFETVILNDTGEIVDTVHFSVPDRSGLGPRAKNLKSLVPEAIAIKLGKNQADAQENSGFWSQPESVRNQEAARLAHVRNDELVD